VLTDVRMPKMTGYEACKLIKNDPATQHIPVVFLSAKGQEAEVQTGLSSGGDEYLLKPFAPDQLTRKVAEILGRPKPE
jgi:CheY-like chemotaxis protein